MIKLAVTVRRSVHQRIGQFNQRAAPLCRELAARSWLLPEHCRPCLAGKTKINRVRFHYGFDLLGENNIAASLAAAAANTRPASVLCHGDKATVHGFSTAGPAGMLAPIITRPICAFARMCRQELTSPPPDSRRIVCAGRAFRF